MVFRGIVRLAVEDEDKPDRLSSQQLRFLFINAAFQFDVNPEVMERQGEQISESTRLLRNMFSPVETIPTRPLLLETVNSRDFFDAAQTQHSATVTNHLRQLRNSTPVPTIAGDLFNNRFAIRGLSIDPALFADTVQMPVVAEEPGIQTISSLFPDQERIVAAADPDVERAVYEQYKLRPQQLKKSHAYYMDPGIPQEIGRDLPGISISAYDPVSNTISCSGDLRISAGLRLARPQEFGIRLFLRSLLTSARGLVHFGNETTDDDWRSGLVDIREYQTATDPEPALRELSSFWKINQADTVNLETEPDEQWPQVLIMMLKSGSPKLKKLIERCRSSELGMAEMPLLQKLIGKFRKDLNDKNLKRRNVKPSIVEDMSKYKTIDVCNAMLWELLGAQYNMVQSGILFDEQLSCADDVRIKQSKIELASIIKDFVALFKPQARNAQYRITEEYPYSTEIIEKVFRTFSENKSSRARIENYVMKLIERNNEDTAASRRPGVWKKQKLQMVKDLMTRTMEQFASVELPHLLALARMLDEMVGLEQGDLSEQQRPPNVSVRTYLASGRKKALNQGSITKLACVSEMEMVLRKWSHKFLSILSTSENPTTIENQIAKCLAFYVANQLIAGAVKYSEIVWLENLAKSSSGFDSSHSTLVISQALLSLGEYGTLLDSVSKALGVSSAVSIAGQTLPTAVCAPDGQNPFGWVLRTLDFGEVLPRHSLPMQIKDCVPLIITGGGRANFTDAATDSNLIRPQSANNIAEMFDVRLPDSRFTPQGKPGKIQLRQSSSENREIQIKFDI